LEFPEKSALGAATPSPAHDHIGTPMVAKNFSPKLLILLFPSSM
jgi:hypothetical protein